MPKLLTLWEIYDATRTPTGAIVCAKTVYTYKGKFRKLVKDPKTLLYQYEYQEKAIAVSDFQRFTSSKRDLDKWEKAFKHAKHQFKRLKSFNKKVKRHISKRYIVESSLPPS